MIKINGLIKKYQHHIIYNIESFVFKDNCCYLIVGSNGSGKTTLIKTIIGIITPTSGFIEMNGAISYVPERFYYPEACSVEKFLLALGTLYNLENNNLINLINDYCIKWSLDKNKIIAKLSKGMQQKVLLIQALIHNAINFIFDEPLSGLDMSSQKDFIITINKLRKLNKTIIIATHYPQYYSGSYDIRLDLLDGCLNENI